MQNFSSFFLMNTESAARYAVEVLHRFAPDEATECVEIGDGNINYVFRVVSLVDGHSVIIKQADRLLRSSGRPLDIYRNKIEAAILQLEGELAPGFVPEVYLYDETMSATSMEDISAYRNLRRELLEGRVYPHLGENISTFLADTLLPTTDLVLDAEEKKRRVRFYTNPELCKITEDLVLTEPYYNYKNRNILFPGNEAFVREFLYEDEALHAEVAALEPERLGDEFGAGRAGGGDVEQGRRLIVSRPGQQCSMAGLFARLGDDREERLAVMQDVACREDRLVVLVRRGDVVLAGNVVGGEDRKHAGRGLDGRQIEREQLAMRDGREADIGMGETGRLGDVVDIEGFASDMLLGGIMLQRRADDRPGRHGVEPFARVSHGRPPPAGRRRGSTSQASLSRSGSAAADCQRPSAYRRPKPACRSAV